MDKKSLTGIGAVVAAGIGSVCCIGPVILAGLGFGAGALSLAREFGVLHIPMMILAALLLGGAFYFHFQEKTASPGKEECCSALPIKKTTHRTVLWFATILTAVLFLYPYVI